MVKKVVERKLVLWQERWDSSSKGRWTYGWWNKVDVRMKSIWVTPGYYLTQFLGGHGNFRSKLQPFGLKSDGFCECGELETAEHVLFVCDLWQNLRSKLKGKLGILVRIWNSEYSYPYVG